MTSNPDNTIRVLFVTGGRRIDGMEIHLITLISSLPASVHCAVCCLDASAEYLTRLHEAGIPHVNLNCPTLVRPGSIFGYMRFERAVRRFRPHIVHTYGFVADVIAGVLRARGSGVRIITSRRGEDANKRHQAVRRLINGVSAKVVCVSSEAARYAQSTELAPAELLEVIPNGVAPNPDRSRAAARHPKDSIRFGTLGIVKPIKGTDLLVDAFMRFDPSQRVELIIAGLIDRPWAEALRERAAADPRIKFLGRSSQPRKFLSELDAFVLPSRSEGMSNALLEAMATGLPCIATDVGSNRSLLNHRDEPPAGVICDATADALYVAMSNMVANEEARRRYGAEAAALVGRKYPIPEMVRRFESLYQAVVGLSSIHTEVQRSVS